MVVCCKELFCQTLPMFSCLIRSNLFYSCPSVLKHNYMSSCLIVSVESLYMLPSTQANPSHAHINYIYIIIYMCIYIYTPCLRKRCAKLYLSQLCQFIFINFKNFWRVDEKMAKIRCYINLFHLTSLMSSQYLVKQKSDKFSHNA